MYKSLLFHEFNETIKLMKMFVDQEKNFFLIENSARLISEIFKNGGKILVCGNGGSHCNAMHFSEELTGRYRETRTGFPAIVISDSSYLSCVSNDFGYEYVFSRYITSIGNSQDLLLVISTSGKSINILNAVEAAYNKDMKIISLLGNKELHRFSNYVDINIHVPYSDFSDHVQEIHLKIIHMLVFLIEKNMERINII